MRSSESGSVEQDHRVDRALAFGVAPPFLYFGLQLIAAPLFPGYSFLSRDASTLGSGGSNAPWVFNGGMFLMAACEAVAAWGFLRGLRRLPGNPALAWATCLALASSAIGSINAALHPQPDPRHTSGALSIMGTGVLLLPVLTSLMLWRMRGRTWVTPLLTTTVVVWLALVPVMSGLAQRVSMTTHIDVPGLQAFLNGYQGLLQRTAAAVLFGPLAFVAWQLRLPRQQ